MKIRKRVAFIVLLYFKGFIFSQEIEYHKIPEFSISVDYEIIEDTNAFIYNNNSDLFEKNRYKNRKRN